MEEGEELEDSYQLHFYALFLLGEFQDREFFPRLMEFVSMPGEMLDYLIGDVITSGLKDILYNTYNGDIVLLKRAVLNETVDEYVRAALLDVMGQIYLDGVLEENEWKDFIRNGVHCGEEHSYFYDALASVICNCHFVDMLSEIKFMLDNDLMDKMILGKYDACVDYMFDYKFSDKTFCSLPINTIDMLKDWAMFMDDSGAGIDEAYSKALEKFIRDETKKKQYRVNSVRLEETSRVRVEVERSISFAA